MHWERLQRIPANPSLWLSCTWPSSIMSDNRPIVPCCTLLLVITDRHTLSTLVVPHQPLNKRQLAVAKTIHRLTDWPTELPNPTNRNNLCDKRECLHQCYRCRRRWHSLPCRTQANLDKWMVVPDQPNKDRCVLCALRLYHKIPPGMSWVIVYIVSCLPRRPPMSKYTIDPRFYGYENFLTVHFQEQKPH